MRTPFIPLKSTLRQPLRTLFLLLLIGAISFAFIGKTVEFLIVQRETNRLGSYYRSIGTLMLLNPDREDMLHGHEIGAGADLISDSPYIALEDRIKLSSGVMPNAYNASIHDSAAEHDSELGQLMKGLYKTDVWFYGTLISVNEILYSEADIFNPDPEEEPYVVGYTLIFKVDTVLGGYPEDIREGVSKAFLFLFEGNEGAIPQIEAMIEGQRYLIRGWEDHAFTMDPHWRNAGANMKLRPLDDEALWYLPLPPNGDLDWNDPDLTGIKNEIDILNQNLHSLGVQATKDMSALIWMQESMRIYYLVDGRWLNRQDDLEGRHVMVIPAGLAHIRDFALGDTITLTLRGLHDPYLPEYIMTETDRERWRSYPTTQVTFEIVGIYDRPGSIYGSVGDDQVYIPYSTLPEGVENTYSGMLRGYYSFVLESSKHQDAFRAAYEDALAEMGIGFFFAENNGQAFWKAVDPLKQSAAANVLVYGGVQALALALAVFLYLRGRRNDFAILRALGVPTKSALRQTLLPIILVGVVGIIGGGFASWRYALDKAGETLSTLPTPAGVVPSPSLSLLWLMGLCAGVGLLLAFFAWVGVRSLGRQPVLALLQGRAAQPTPRGREQKQASPTDAGETVQPVNTTTADQPTRVATSRKGYFTILARFAFRRITRLPLKSLLTLGVALGFVLALGWIRWTMDRNQAVVDHLYETTVVEVDIVKALGGVGIPAHPVQTMLQSGFVQESTLEAVTDRTGIGYAETPSEPIKYHDVSYALWGFNQPETFFTRNLPGGTVKYANGWDETLFTQDWHSEDINQTGIPAVFPESILLEHNLALGEVIYLEKRGGIHKYLIAGYYTGPIREISKQFLLPMFYRTPPILVPVSGLQITDGDALRYILAQFTIDPAKNRALPAFKATMEAEFNETTDPTSAVRVLFWDEELRTVVAPLEKNFRLLQVLYPVTIAVAALIGGGLCLLLVMQTAQDSAILRVLGTPRGAVRSILVWEQGVLSLVGLVLGLVGLAIIRGDWSAALAGQALLNAGLYLLGALVGAVLGAISVTKQKPLELLQVKE